MADDRYRNHDNRWDRDPQDYGRDYGSGRDYSSSSAREYGAAGEYDRNFRGGGTGYGDQGRGGYGRDAYGQGNRDPYDGRSGGRNYGGDYRGNYGTGSFRGSYGSDGHRFAESGRDHANRDHGRGRPQGRDYGRAPQGYDYQDRGFFERAGDEVRSWFGDEEAERRREFDQRYDERMGGYDYRRGGQSYGGGRGHDSDYSNWRRSQIEALDRDYDEYRRENATKFDNEFGSWRNQRQTQRSSLSKVNEHMEVVGSDGEHVGTVDKVRGDRIILTKNDTDAGGRHHSIPSRWIQSVDDKVTISKTAEDAKAHWRDEERSGALFGNEGREGDSSVNLNRSFSGTY